MCQRAPRERHFQADAASFFAATATGALSFTGVYRWLRLRNPKRRQLESKHPVDNPGRVLKKAHRAWHARKLNFTYTRAPSPAAAHDTEPRSCTYSHRPTPLCPLAGCLPQMAIERLHIPSRFCRGASGGVGCVRAARKRARVAKLP